MSLLRSISWRGRATATTLAQIQKRGPSGCRTAPAWRTIEHALYTRTQSNMFLSYSRTTNPPPRRRAGGSKPFLSDLCPSLEATGELLFLSLAHSVLSTLQSRPGAFICLSQYPLTQTHPSYVQVLVLSQYHPPASDQSTAYTHLHTPFTYNTCSSSPSHDYICHFNVHIAQALGPRSHSTTPLPCYAHSTNHCIRTSAGRVTYKKREA